MTLPADISSLKTYLVSIRQDVDDARRVLAVADAVDWQSASADRYRGLVSTARTDLFALEAAIDTVTTSLTNASS